MTTATAAPPRQTVPTRLPPGKPSAPPQRAGTPASALCGAHPTGGGSSVDQQEPLPASPRNQVRLAHEAGDRPLLVADTSPTRPVTAARGGDGIADRPHLAVAVTDHHIIGHSAPPDTEGTPRGVILARDYPPPVWRGIPTTHLANAPWPRRDQLLDLLNTDCIAAATRNQHIHNNRRLRHPDLPADTPTTIAARLAVWGLTPTDAMAAEKREYARLKMRRLRANRRRDTST